MNSSEKKTPFWTELPLSGWQAACPWRAQFPGFWRNQLEGVESISHFRPEELEISNKASVANDPRYIMARSILDDVDLFDAGFFRHLSTRS